MSYWSRFEGIRDYNRRTKRQAKLDAYGYLIAVAAIIGFLILSVIKSSH